MDQDNRLPDKSEPEAETPSAGGLQDWLAGAEGPGAAALPDWLSAGLPSFLETAPTEPVPPPAPAAPKSTRPAALPKAASPAPRPQTAAPAAQPAGQLQVLIGRPKTLPLHGQAVFHFHVRNTLPAALANVVLKTRFGSGWQQPAGAAAATAIGALVSGATHTVTLTARAEASGRLTVHFEASADGGWTVAGETAVAVDEPAPPPTVQLSKPELTLQITGPSGSPMNRPIEMRIEVANRGTATATEVQLAYRVDEGIEVVDGGEFGQYAAGQSWLRWPLDVVKPGQGRQLFFRVRAVVTGNFVNRVTLSSADGAHVVAEAPMAVDFDASASSSRTLDHLVADIDREARGAAPAERPLPAAGRSRATEQHIVFQLAGTDFAVPISRVREIGRGMVVQPLPNVPDWLLGVANIRGDVTSMVDLVTFLGMERTAPGEHTMVVHGADGGFTTGLIVDRIRGIRPLAPDAVALATTNLGDRLRQGGDNRVVQFLRGVTEQDGRLLAILDMDRLLLSRELRQFEHQ